MDRKKNNKALSFLGKVVGNLGLSMFFDLLAQILIPVAIIVFLYFTFK